MGAIAKEPFVPICCVCGLVRDELGDTAGDESWSDLGSYLDRHGMRGADYKLTHTYCPICVHRYVSIGKGYAGEEQMSRRPGLTITGLMYMPPVEGPLPTLILLHGYIDRDRYFAGADHTPQPQLQSGCARSRLSSVHLESGLSGSGPAQSNRGN